MKQQSGPVVSSGAFQPQTPCDSVVSVTGFVLLQILGTLHSLGLTIYTENGFKQNQFVLQKTVYISETGILFSKSSTAEKVSAKIMQNTTCAKERTCVVILN